ncbi:5043_t:CDS:2 [Paraglomus occultum]|uniref:5043_t:CDS:1 n=1 Tax=Paraglomus occultum TaxID=144539 RepID=A0A9N8ZP46_9GLOM|nr:5043_t:CDS:2 [Paraglomus occultum]
MLNSICWFLPFLLVVIVGTDAIVRTITVGPDSLQTDFDFAVDGDVFSFVWSSNVKAPVRVYEVYDNQSCAVMSKGIDSNFHTYPNTYKYTTDPEPIRLTEYPSPPIIYDFYLTAQGAQGCDQGPDSRLEIEVYKPGETPTDIPSPESTGSSSDIISTSPADTSPVPTSSTAVTSNATPQPTLANNTSNETSSHTISIPLMAMVTVVGVFLSFI